MFETVRDATITDAFRGLAIVFFLLLLSVSVVYLWQAAQAFHYRGKARLRAYEKSLQPVPVEPSNVILFPSNQRRAG